MKRRSPLPRILFALLIALSAATVCAQVGLPPVHLPQLPLQTPDLGRTVQGTLESTAKDARRLRIRELLREQRQVLDTDPAGQPVVRSEVIAISPSAAALERARSFGFEIARRGSLDDVGLEVIVLRAPAGMSTRGALRELKRLDPEGSYDFNHLYFESGETEATIVQPSLIPRATTTNATVRVGLIDGGVDRSHPAFATTSISIHGCDAEFPTEHGTAVASLLVGHSEQFSGAAPDAHLYAADVYCGQPTGGAVDSIAAQLGWLMREQVPVINVSLVGPSNLLLERIVHIAIARGHIIVAAVGNDGPTAAPLYPAAYPGVVGVTGVDAHRRVLLEACRGEHVKFAAPGADMTAGALRHVFTSVRGTSFAAPLVAGLLARLISVPDPLRAESAIAALAAEAIDLGSRGRDKTFGDGLVGEQLRVANPPK
jgi:hypothetical protein